MEALKRLKRDGYVVVPWGGTRGLYDALRLINSQFPVQGMDPQDAQIDFDYTYFPDSASAKEIVELYELVAPILEQALDKPVRPSSAQIALRFPGPDRDLKPHIDGSYGREWAPHFSALVAVFLSDVGSIDGATHVWPGSHLKLGPHSQDVVQGRIPLEVLQQQPVPVTGNAGDVMIAHPLLVHSVSAVQRQHIRYTVFFRVKVEAQESIGVELLQNPWLGWTI